MRLSIAFVSRLLFLCPARENLTNALAIIPNGLCHRMKSFDELFRERNWQPIRNCPGRFVLREGDGGMSLAQILGEEGGCVSRHRVKAARDVVLVLRLDAGGGIISYARADGSLLHTLNTPEGFERKLLQLGIEHKG